MFYYNLFIFFLFYPVSCLDNGLARVPPMGWMSWGYLRCNVKCDTHTNTCLNEAVILSVADSFFKEGYKDAGYEYIIIDDCWSEKSRDENGSLVADRKRFPNGMKYLADYIHSKGLKFGMYSNAGKTTCEGYPGSQAHLEIDAKTFAQWDVDYVKFDGCYVRPELLNKVYIEFGRALNNTGRPMVYSCSWPYYLEFLYDQMPNFTAITPHCNLWRNYHDINFYPKYAWTSVKWIIAYFTENNERLKDIARPGHWNDPDMVMVGNSVLSENESRVQLSVWAMLSAPLLLSCDMRKVTGVEKRQILNMELIAIDQDPLGITADVFSGSDPHTSIWIKKQRPLIGDIFHKYSIAFVNLNDEKSYFNFSLKNYNLDSVDQYEIMDVWSGSFEKNITAIDSLSLEVPPRDAVLYTLYPRWGNSNRGSHA